MQTRYDLMWQCIDSLSRALIDGRLSGQFLPVHGWGIELIVCSDNLTAEKTLSELIDDVIRHLWRIHRIDSRSVLVSRGSHPHPRDLHYHDTQVNRTDRLPLNFHIRNSRCGRKTPELSIIIG
jgi:hypothetical protein